MTGILSYPGYYAAPRTVVAFAVGHGRVLAGGVRPVGPEDQRHRRPTLVADGNDDALDAETNDQMLAGTIPGPSSLSTRTPATLSCSKIRTAFVPRVEEFLRPRAEVC